MGVRYACPQVARAPGASGPREQPVMPLGLVTPDGRTILLDWAYPGSGPIHWDLGWYLALNSARLPVSKEATIDALRDALERRGIDTDGWFDLQLDLCLLGIAACFGWEKAMGNESELRWWEDRALRGAGRLAQS